MNRAYLLVGGVVILIALFFAGSFVYTINPTQQVLLVQFGAPQAVVTDQGLHTKLPWQTVLVFDRRLLIAETNSEEVIAQDKKRLVVDAFARWRIVDPLKFYQVVVNENGALARLVPILSSNVRRVLGSQNFAAVLSTKRAKLMEDIRDNVNQEAAGFGIKVVDVRIRHADLPQENSEAIYQRMQKERQREASEYRAEGDETAQRIRARAEREVTVIKAEATRESEILRGQGDAEKTRVLAEAYGRDPSFFAFYRSMQAYRDALPAGNTTVFLSPKSDFFRYFGDGSGGK
ncbi:MAG TPA: protease modulator HflC [Rhizomicrobium sp.]|jgi:membrane protease subunit HflC|nr:protease modulator HflC [Rhizomicrobium sp.]